MLQEKEVFLPNDTYQKYATVYTDTETPPKACILYFHGGGLLYGRRGDLPELHKETFTRAGYCIIAFDYPLAPSAKLDIILEDVCASISHYLENSDLYAGGSLPYFLWGRSAGAYLCLLATAKKTPAKPPKGILSYYGYGFLNDGWFLVPSKYYCSLPPVNDSILRAIPADIHADGGLDTHYSVYVCARQKGNWIDLIYNGRQKFFYLDYTLRTCEKMPCPLFCAHSTGDTDVPYSEFVSLCDRYQPYRFVASRNMHDFDRDVADPVTGRLLESSIKFMDLKMEQ